MTWVKIDDRYATHRKMLRAGTAAIALDVAGMCYAAGHNTDGFVPTEALTAAAPFLTRGQATTAAGRLVEVGRWVKVDGGWRIHDYLTYNPSSAERDNRRKAAAARTGRWRGRRRDGDASPDDERRNGDASPVRDDERTRDATPLRVVESLKGSSLQPPPRDPSPPDAPPSPSPSGADSASDTRCRHGNDATTCGVCSDAVGAAPPSRLSATLRPAHPSPEASP